MCIKLHQVNWRWLWISLSIVLLDGVVKHWMMAHLVMGTPKVLTPYLQWSLNFNSGIAFSFLSSGTFLSHYFLITMNLVISAVLLIWLLMFCHGQKILAFGLSFILGGAIGNIIDRFCFGFVVDFIDVHWATWHFPIFNLADSAITIGVALILCFYLFQSPSSHRRRG